MSKIMLPSDRKPPLAESHTKLRSSRILRSSVRSIQAPSASVKSQTRSRLWDMEESHMLPVDQSISCELRALANMVEHEFGNQDAGSTDFTTTVSANQTPLFERGRFYEEYSARRDERLKRKKCGETGEDSRSICGLGVSVESGKRRNLMKSQSLRKSVPANLSIDGTHTPRYCLRKSIPANLSIDGTDTPRYSLRSSTRAKENKKPIIPNNAARSMGDGDRKVEVRKVRKT